MALPTKQAFFSKFLSAIGEDWSLAKAYFERFGVAHKEKTPEEIWCQLVDKLSNYGGYEVRRGLIECMEIRPRGRALMRLARLLPGYRQPSLDTRGCFKRDRLYF